MDTKPTERPKTVSRANTNPEQLSLPREQIVAEEIQFSTGTSSRAQRCETENLCDSHPLYS
jgi:hypothetical protein